MYELIQAGPRTYYIDCPAKIGVYRFSENGVCLIDAGNDKDTGRKIQKILEQNGWTAKLILCTHSHADHIGGCRILQERLNCPVYAPGAEADFTCHPFLEPSFLYGGFPFRELRNKFLMARESSALPLTPEVLPEGMEMARLDGHSFAMAAFRTPDDVWFLADSLSSEAVLQKYHIGFLYDVEGYLTSLDRVEQLKGRLFIPSHAAPTEDIRPLAKLNRAKVMEVLALLREVCSRPIAFDDILKAVFDHYGLMMDLTQYVLVGSTVRSCLSCLRDRGELEPCIKENRLMCRPASV